MIGIGTIHGAVDGTTVAVGQLDADVRAMLQLGAVNPWDRALEPHIAIGDVPRSGWYYEWMEWWDDLSNDYTDSDWKGYFCFRGPKQDVESYTAKVSGAI